MWGLHVPEKDGCSQRKLGASTPVAGQAQHGLQLARIRNSLFLLRKASKERYEVLKVSKVMGWVGPEPIGLVSF